MNGFHLIKIRFFAILKSFWPFSTCNSYFPNAKCSNKYYSYPHNSVLNSTLWENSIFPVFCFINFFEMMLLQPLKCQFSKLSIKIHIKIFENTFHNIFSVIFVTNNFWGLCAIVWGSRGRVDLCSQFSPGPRGQGIFPMPGICDL